MPNIEVTIKVPDKLDKYFRVLSDLFEWGFNTPNEMYTHFVLDALGAELDLIRESVSPHQYEELTELIEKAKDECCPPKEDENEKNGE